jgi:glucoamylase
MKCYWSNLVFFWLFWLVHGLYIKQNLINPSDSRGNDKQQVPFANEGENVRLLDFESWIDRQKDISFASILENIGGISNSLPKSVVNGAVIASPSNNDPDYFYQWTRDAALTITSLVLQISDKKLKNIDNLRHTVESYIENQYYIQRVDNLSGNCNDTEKSCLGEPKFMPDNSPFNHVWGRPQRDGPGLRASTIIHYVNLLDQYETRVINNFLNNTQDIYFEIIKPDLIYIIYNWQKVGFDLWEEVNSHHFFTSITQMRALLDGISIAKRFGDDPQFINDLHNTMVQLKKFILFESGFISQFSYILETPQLVYSGKRSGLDLATLLGSIHAHPLSYTYDVNYNLIPFNTNSTYLLNTLYFMVADMKYRYPINHGRISDKLGGFALGRYPEDVYDGHGTSEGNPWFISTATAAEVMYRYIYQLKSSKVDLFISSDNLQFLDQFLDPEIQINETIEYGSISFNKILTDMFDYADSYLKIIKEHVDDNGFISEQFNKYSGFMQGAPQLTWSHSALWNAFRWRNITNSILQD